MSDFWIDVMSGRYPDRKFDKLDRLDNFKALLQPQAPKRATKKAPVKRAFPLTRAEAKARVRQNLDGFVERQKVRDQQRAAMRDENREDQAAYQKAYRTMRKGA